MNLALCMVVVALISFSNAKNVPVLYAAGGTPSSDQTDITNRVAVFRLDSKQWCEGAVPLPVPLKDHAAVQFRNKLYLSGGVQTGGSFLAGTYDVFEFDPAKNKYRQMPRLIRNRQYHAAAVVNDKIFIAGGEVDQNQNLNWTKTTEYFNGQVWKNGPPMKHGREWHKLVAVTCKSGNKSFLWALGGNMFGTNTTEYLDLSEGKIGGSWTPGPIMLNERAMFTAVAIENVIYVCGGALMGDHLCEKLTLDPNDCTVGHNTWTRIANVAGNTHKYPQMVQYGGKLLLVGVQEKCEREPCDLYDNRNIHQYDPVTDKWSLFHHQTTMVPNSWYGTLTQIDMPETGIVC